MTPREFVLVYVVLPLAVAVGWLLWRGRRFLRNILLYAAVVAVLLVLIRVGHMAWSSWEAWRHPVVPPQAYPACIAPGAQILQGPKGSCWT
jgi:hypothetical protein